MTAPKSHVLANHLSSFGTPFGDRQYDFNALGDSDEENRKKKNPKRRRRKKKKKPEGKAVRSAGRVMIETPRVFLRCRACGCSS